MVKMINRYTCGEMWIADDRVEEYKALGHKVAECYKPAAPAPVKKPATKTAAKTTTKKTKAK